MPRHLSRFIRLFPLSAAGLLPCLLLAALCAAQEKKPAKPKTAGNKFKNVRILKNLSEDDLLAVMRNFDEDLGVNCAYCHVMVKFRSFEDCYKDDKPPKRQARQMMLMTRDLNKRYKTVTAKVTCWTCHAGKKQPVNAPPAQ